MTRKYSLMVDDRPLSEVERDLLFAKKDNTFLWRLRQIAGECIAPVLHAANAPSMTFAIHGQWGSGKSSSLNLIRLFAQDMIHKQAPDRAGRLSWSEFYAPMYESMGADIRTTIIFEILRKLDPDGKFTEEIIQGFLNTGAIDASLSYHDVRKEIRIRKALQQLPELKLPLESLIAEKLLLGGKKEDVVPRAHIMFADELDRCTPQFTTAFLTVSHFWARTQNLFFVIAVDENHLVNAFEQQGLPGHALEKYVQFSVTVPRVLRTIEAKFEYLCGLLPQVELPQDKQKAVERLLKDGVDKPLESLIDPLVRLDSRNSTPRGLKRMFNRLMADIGAMEPGYAENFLKSQVIGARWSRFYEEYVTVSPEHKQQKRLRDLEAIGQDARRRLADKELSEVLQWIVNRAGLDGIEIPDQDAELVLYLGLDPVLFRSEDTASQPEHESQIGDEPSESQIDIELRTLYYQIEADEGARGGAATLPQLRQFLKFSLEHEKDLTAFAANFIGNVALKAEREKAVKLAEDLFELALRIDGYHANNAQGYVSFILDEQISELYPRAKGLLEMLKSHPHASQHKPARRAVLEIQYGTVTQDGIDLDLSLVELIGQMRTKKEPPRTDDFVSVFSLLNRMNDYNGGREFARWYYDVALGWEDRAIALNLVADLLYRSNEESDERESMELYHYLVETGLGCSGMNKRVYIRILTNYGILLTKYGNRKLAAEVFLKAHRLEPDNQGLLNAFSAFLADLGRADLASQMLQGRPLSETPDIPDSQQGHALGYWEGEHWWKREDLPQMEPCL